MRIIKKYLPYVIAFFLIYLGPEQIGPTTFSQLWKIPVFIFLVWHILIIRNNKKENFIKWSYARAAKNLVTSGFSISYLAGIIDFFRYMMFPLMYEYAFLKIKSMKSLDKILLGVAQFVIISGIPFVLGIMKSKAADGFLIDGSDSYSGIFQNTHGSSITTTTAVLILAAYIKVKSPIIKYKKLNYALLAFGMYLIYSTFIRTGYAMFFIGLVLLFLPQKLSLKQIMKTVAVIALLVIGFLILLETNEFFYNRIFDIRNGKQTAAGSGRLLFWKSSFDLWYDGNVFEMLFGFGYDGLVDNMYKEIGLRVYAHNEFFTQLGQNGLLGIIFFLGYLASLFKFIWRRRKMESFRLAIAIFFLYVSLMLTQGGMWFELDVFMVLVYVKLEFEHLIFKKNRQMFYDLQNAESEELSSVG